MQICNCDVLPVIPVDAQACAGGCPALSCSQRQPHVVLPGVEQQEEADEVFHPALSRELSQALSRELSQALSRELSHADAPAPLQQPIAQVC